MAAKRVKQKDLDEKLVSIMKEWQKVEDRSIKSISSSLDKIDNPLVQQVLRIIQSDSIMHRKVQQLILDSIQKEAFSLTPEELGEVWSVIEQHIAMERDAVELAERAKEIAWNFVHRYLITYLVTDERKHDAMLAELESVKRKIYPYA